MQVRDGMSATVLTVGPGHTLREAARLMSQRTVGAAIVIDPEQPGPGILTERDLLDSLGAGQDPDTEKVGDHLSATLTFARLMISISRGDLSEITSLDLPEICQSGGGFLRCFRLHRFP